MWIDTKVSKPFKEGVYTCLVVQDDYGTLKEEISEVFNGEEWCHYNSNRQFIAFWWATKEEYEIVTKYLDDEKIKNLDKLKLESSNHYCESSGEKCNKQCKFCKNEE